VKITMWRATVLAAGCAIALLGCGKESGNAKNPGPPVLKINEWSYSAADMEKEIGQQLRQAPQMRPAPPAPATDEPDDEGYEHF